MFRVMVYMFYTLENHDKFLLRSEPRTERRAKAHLLRSGAIGVYRCTINFISMDLRHDDDHDLMSENKWIIFSVSGTFQLEQLTVVSSVIACGHRSSNCKISLLANIGRRAWMRWILVGCGSSAKARVRISIQLRIQTRPSK